MMMHPVLPILLVLLFSLIQAEDVPDEVILEYYREPEQVWTVEAVEESGGIGEGNGLYVSPDGSLLVATARDGSVTGMDPATGEQVFQYIPQSLALPVNCYSGVTFSGNDYFVYAIADGAPDPLNAPVAQTRVVALDFAGQVVFQSQQIPGIAAGTPVVDSSGKHILVTHNQDGLTGTLSIFLTSSETPVFSQGYTGEGVNGTMVERPFSPIGFYHNPITGWYDGGEGNTNDIFIFGWSTPRTATQIVAGDGQSFVVQFPMDYAGDGQGLTMETLGSRTDFHAITPPILTNQGRSMYWAVTKSAHDCYVGEEGLLRTLFSRGRSNRLSFDRAVKPVAKFQSPRAPPALTSDPVMPQVLGVGANNQIFRDSYNFSDVRVADTTDIVSSRLIVTLDDARVLYATQNTLVTTPPNGQLVCAGADGLGVQWTAPVPGGALGDIAMSKDGTIAYVAGAAGGIQAFRFADNNSPTQFPTMVPTNAPTEEGFTPSPTMAPTTAAPTVSPPEPDVLPVLPEGNVTDSDPPPTPDDGDDDDEDEGTTGDLPDPDRENPVEEPPTSASVSCRMGAVAVFGLLAAML